MGLLGDLIRGAHEVTKEIIPIDEAKDLAREGCEEVIDGLKATTEVIKDLFS